MSTDVMMKSLLSPSLLIRSTLRIRWSLWRGIAVMNQWNRSASIIHLQPENKRHLARRNGDRMNLGYQAWMPLMSSQPRSVTNHLHFGQPARTLSGGSLPSDITGDTDDASSDLMRLEENESDVMTYGDLGNALYGQPPAPEGSRAAQRTYALIARLEWHEALAMIQNHHTSLDKVHFALTMKHLHRQLLRLPHELRAEFISEVKREPAFELLKALLALRGQYYEPGIAADMLLFLRRFDLDSDDPAVKVYLHLVKYHLADLPLYLLIKVGQTVSTMTSDDQIDLIFKGIPLLEKFDPKVIDNLTHWEAVYLLNLFGAEMNETSIAATLRVITNELPLVKKHLSKVLFRALANLHLLQDELLEHCLYWFLTYPEDLTLDDMISILKSCHKVYLYDVGLFKCISSKTQELGSYSDKFHVLKRYSECGIYDSALSTDVLSNFDKSVVGSVLDHLSSDYSVYKTSSTKPTELHFFYDLLHMLALRGSAFESPETVSARIKDIVGCVEDCAHYFTAGELLSLLLDLTVLNEHSAILTWRFLRLAEKWLQEETSEDNSEAIPDSVSSCLPNSMLSKVQLVNLLARRAECGVPESLATLLSTKQTEYHGAPSELAGGLELVCQDPSHVHHAVTSQDGIHIDHVVLLPEDWSSVQLSKEPESKVKPDQRVAVLALDSHCFFRNTGQLKPHTRWCAERLQQEGYLVALVKLPIWRRIPDYERADYLQRKLSYAPQDQDLLMLGMDGY